MSKNAGCAVESCRQVSLIQLRSILAKRRQANISKLLTLQRKRYTVAMRAFRRKTVAESQIGVSVHRKRAEQISPITPAANPDSPLNTFTETHAPSL